MRHAEGVSQPVPQIPGPGQESVWAYPRPPRVERTAKRIEIWLGGRRMADTTGAYRVLETSHPPAYYLPGAAFEPGVLRSAPGASLCEWKDQASYWTVSSGETTAQAAGWSYEHPQPAFHEIAGYIAVYAGHMDECRVAGERVTPQPGGFYGGWVTADVVGPFKGEPGSLGW